MPRRGASPVTASLSLGLSPKIAPQLCIIITWSLQDLLAMASPCLVLHRYAALLVIWELGEDPASFQVSLSHPPLQELQKWPSVEFFRSPSPWTSKQRTVGKKKSELIFITINSRWLHRSFVRDVRDIYAHGNHLDGWECLHLCYAECSISSYCERNLPPCRLLRQSQPTKQASHKVFRRRRSFERL